MVAKMKHVCYKKETSLNSNLTTEREFIGTKTSSYKLKSDLISVGNVKNDVRMFANFCFGGYKMKIKPCKCGLKMAFKKRKVTQI